MYFVTATFRNARLSLRIPSQPSGHYMYRTVVSNYMYRLFNIQLFYVLPTQCICFLRGSENKQRLFHCTALTGWFL